MSLLIADQIGKNYQVGEVVIPALKGVSFEIAPASFVSFIGPSGSGKTTLLNLIGCLDTPTTGRRSSPVSETPNSAESRTITGWNCG